jgi:hypothetical protein
VTRRRSHRDDGRRPDPARWGCLGGHDKFKTWELAGTEYLVKHCGHPTANYPWYGERPDGSMITSGKDGTHGMAFRYLDDAKVAVELDHAGKRSEIALTASLRAMCGAADGPSRCILDAGHETHPDPESRTPQHSDGRRTWPVARRTTARRRTS